MLHLMYNQIIRSDEKEQMEDYIYGRNAVTELLRENKRDVSKIIIMKTVHENEKITEIIKTAKERNIIYQFLNKEAFSKYSNIVHQGVIAYVSPVEHIELEEFTEKKQNGYKKVIITDGVEDPHNMGSLIRTAVCAGFDAIIYPSRRNAAINSTVEKASAGAVNRISLIRVNSLSSAITKLKDNNFWIIASDIKSEDNYYDINYCDMNFAIVAGSEKNGISSTILKLADYRVKIPMLSNFDSLNVANAVSIIIYEATKQIIQKSGNRI